MALSTTVALEFLARNRAASGMRSFERGVTNVTYRLRRLMTTVLAIAGIGGFGYMIKRQMEAIDKIAKMSDELQISTQALTSWEHAAKISGTSIEQLHKGLEIFVRRMGEAKQGIGEGKRGLEMLGITAQQLEAQGMEDAFLRIAEAVKNAQTSTDRLNIAYQFFGRQGVQLVNLFLEGRAGIEAYRKEAEKLGLTFDRIDAAKVEAANDALTRMKDLFIGLFRTTTIELAPYIEAAATAFVNWATAGEGVGANVTYAFEAMTIATIKFTGELQKIPNIWLSIKARTAETVALWEKWAPVGQLNRVIREIRGIKAPGELAERYRAGIKDTTDEINKAQQFFERIRKGAEERAAAVARRGARPRLGFGADVEDIASAEQKKMDILRARVREEIALTGRLDEPRQHAKMIIDFQAAAMAEYGENSQRAIEVTRSFRAELKQLEQAESLARIAESIGQSFTTAFEDAILEAQNLNDVLLALSKNIQKALFQEIVSRPLSQAISSIAGSLMGLPMTTAKVGHGGGIIGDIAYRRTVPSAVFENAPRFHDLAPNEVAVIAQRGEEIRRPGGQPEGANINYTFYVYAIDAAGVAQFLRQYKRQIASTNQEAYRDNHPGRRQ